MARQIVILEATQGLGGGQIGFRYALWAAVPAARQSWYAFTPQDGSAVSAVVGATTAELAAISSGAVTEQIGTGQWPAGTTVAQIKAFLIAQFAEFQVAVTTANPWQIYGSSYDGTSWTVVANQ